MPHLCRPGKEILKEEIPGSHQEPDGAGLDESRKKEGADMQSSASDGAGMQRASSDAGFSPKPFFACFPESRLAPRRRNSPLNYDSIQNFMTALKRFVWSFFRAGRQNE